MSILNIFLLMIGIFITHLIVMLFHELAHKSRLEKNKISCEIKWNFSGIKLFKNSSLAGCFFDANKFDKLKYNEKKKILFAGIKTELFFVLLFLILFLISLISYRGEFLFYYFSLNFLTLLGRVFLNYFAKGSDGEKLTQLNKSFRLSVNKRKGEE